MTVTMNDLEFKLATPDDAAILAEMNRQLIIDEGHRNRMSLVQLQDRMAGRLRSDYRAVIFLCGSVIAGYVLYRNDPDWVFI